MVSDEEESLSGMYSDEEAISRALSLISSLGTSLQPEGEAEVRPLRPRV